MRLKGILFLLGLFLLVVSVGSVSAQTCTYVNSNNCDGDNNIVLRLSEFTNAHVALANQPDFPGKKVLCCDFGGGSTSCDGNEKFLGISSSTNAHAEVPDLLSSYYDADACYSGFKEVESIDATKECGNSTEEEDIPKIEIIYLSTNEDKSFSNAHSEKPEEDNYESKICATPVFDPADCDLTSASWDGISASEGSNAGFIVEGTPACSDAPGGAQISIEVFRGGTSCSDIDGCTNPENVNFDDSGNATGTWTAEPVHDDKYTFTATVVGNDNEFEDSSNSLLVTEGKPEWCEAEEINLCWDYNKDRCEADLCITAKHTVESGEGYNMGDGFCDEERNCECYWDSGENECDAKWNTDGDGTDGGTCTYTREDVTGSCETDEFITFNWTAEWEWHDGNIGEEPGEDGCLDNYVLDDGLCYLDSEKQMETCQSDSRVALCPAQIALPFFNVYSFLIAILLIVAVYMILNMKKTGKKKEHGSRKKGKK
ncbi:MAG: hypothetical protein WDZ69_01630 [Candidatus Pacearchaeota archaeon]